MHTKGLLLELAFRPEISPTRPKSVGVENGGYWMAYKVAYDMILLEKPKSSASRGSPNRADLYCVSSQLFIASPLFM